jgi:precorrin-4 methylase
LLCADPAVFRRVHTALKVLGVRVDLVPSVPAVDEAAASMREQFAPLAAPGITLDLDA